MRIELKKHQNISKAKDKEIAIKLDLAEQEKVDLRKKLIERDQQILQLQTDSVNKSQLSQEVQKRNNVQAELNELKK